MSNASSSVAQDRVKWVRTVNDRWIVHEGLDVTTRRYLDELEAVDPSRLKRACALAYRVAKAGAPDEDPKPRFYGGLYALATRDEVARYLEDYRFIASLHPEGSPDCCFGPETRVLIDRLRGEIAEQMAED